MPNLEMRKTSKWFYGRWHADGKPVTRNLDVKIEGRRPASINEFGDRRFETSRAKALAKLDELIHDTKTKRAEELVQTIYKIRTGSRISTIPLDGIYERWLLIPRRRGHPGQAHITWAKKVFTRLAEFLNKEFHVTEMSQVTHTMAIAFLAAEEKRGIAGRTWNAGLSLLKGAFKHLRREGGFIENPFDEIVGRDEHTIHRKPFTPDELSAVIAAAQKDAFCYPLIVTGLCTAMRRGDVCQLKWADVDLTGGTINVRTIKTGEWARIPIFPLLSDLLKKQPHEGKYCFPVAAKLYKEKPDKINTRLNAVFHAAGFLNADKDGNTKNSVDPQKLAEARERLQQVDTKEYTAKVRQNLLKVFDLYAGGAICSEIAAKLKMSKGSVSHYLSRIEQIVGFTIVRTARVPIEAGGLGLLHEKRDHGLRRVNVHGFHSLRSTFVTLALTAGVPVELVRTVTGHTLTETVLAHYFHPNQKQLQAAFLTAMPKMLTSGAQGSDIYVVDTTDTKR